MSECPNCGRPGDYVKMRGDTSDAPAFFGEAVCTGCGVEIMDYDTEVLA